MNNRDFFPIILGSDTNAYGTARLFHEKYGIKPLLLCAVGLNATKKSSILQIKVIPGFNTKNVFIESLKAELQRLKKEYKKLLVIPCSDYYTKLMILHYDSFDGLIANRFISEELYNKVGTKDSFYALCREHGLKYPETVVCTPEQRETVLEELPFGFPMILKPENSNSTEYLECCFRGKKKVYFLKSREEYFKVVRAMTASGYHGNLILQRLIPGGDTTSRVLNCYSGLDGKVRFMCLGKVLLEDYNPTMLGNYVAIVSGSDEEIYKRVETFLNDVGYVGFSNFDLKYDEKSGEFLFFELNPRLGRSSYYVRAADYNTMELLVDDAVYGKNIETCYADREGIWSLVPKFVIKRYVRNPETKKEVNRILAEKGLVLTMKNPEEKSLIRKVKHYLDFYKSGLLYGKYWFDKEKLEDTEE